MYIRIARLDQSIWKTSPHDIMERRHEYRVVIHWEPQTATARSKLAGSVKEITVEFSTYIDRGGWIGDPNTRTAL